MTEIRELSRREFIALPSVSAAAARNGYESTCLVVSGQLSQPDDISHDLTWGRLGG
jgi:hypothetical protein